MRYLSLFSGIEAASVAAAPLGWEPVAFAELDPFACAVLAQRFPDVPNLGDVTKIDWSDFNERYGAVDLLVGGSPCQSFSVAGNRSGLRGASGLMFEYIRAVAQVRPRWLVWENVPGALSSTGGRTSDACSESWMSSGTVWHGEYLTRSSSEWPSAGAVSFLSDALETSEVPQRYFLSERACRGVLERARRRERSLPPLLEEALERQASSSTRAQGPEA